MNNSINFIKELGYGPDDWDDSDTILIPIIKNRKLSITLAILTNILSYLIILESGITIGIPITLSCALPLVILPVWYMIMGITTELKERLMQRV